MREVSSGRKAKETAKVAGIGTGYSGSTLDKVDRGRARVVGYRAFRARPCG